MNISNKSSQGVGLEGPYYQSWLWLKVGLVISAESHLKLITHPPLWPSRLESQRREILAPDSLRISLGHPTRGGRRPNAQILSESTPNWQGSISNISILVVVNIGQTIPSD